MFCLRDIDDKCLLAGLLTTFSSEDSNPWIQKYVSLQGVAKTVEENKDDPQGFLIIIGDVKSSDCTYLS